MSKRVWIKAALVILADNAENGIVSSSENS